MESDKGDSSHGTRTLPRGTVLQPSGDSQSQVSHPVRPQGVTTEVIKVYLESHKQKTANQQPPDKMLTDEVSQIQEVRYCLKTLREQMAARHNNSNNNKFPANGFTVRLLSNQSPVTNGIVEAKAQGNEEECTHLRELTKHLYAQLKDMEKRHQEERKTEQAENKECRQRLEEQTELLQKAEKEALAQGHRAEELQRQLSSVELESAALLERFQANEAELQQLKAMRDNDKEKRCEELEKELAVFKEKNHQLDDMLKSQQRKVRNMIEQLQNTRTIMQDRDRLISELTEKVAFIEAENRQMHDQMDHFLDETPSKSLSDREGQIVYSKPLTPTSNGNKSLPFIKVIEIKS